MGLNLIQYLATQSEPVSHIVVTLSRVNLQALQEVMMSVNKQINTVGNIKQEDYEGIIS